ncbi:MBL fold metallo-hydrolase [Euzebya tangerina]|uniref:MBL fold metallo-hydrolase n=1 Tax=Euzebya tangerina TaxID=591198 RepID=UPI00196B2BCA|nr:MBL fold metallo-hydrolase [Euzebya tangerina]
MSLIVSGDHVVVVDPGLCPGPDSILGPLADAGYAPADVTDVVLSHHHPDHTRWMGLFGHATVHDHWATYAGDLWTARPAEGAEVCPGVTLLHTPGHTMEDISTVVDTEEGVVVFSHLWWTAESESDPRAVDLDLLHEHRARVVDIADRIVPGHGPAFAVTAEVPR